MFKSGHKIYLIVLICCIMFPDCGFASHRITLIYNVATQAYEKAIQGFLNGFDGTADRIILSELAPGEIRKSLGKLSSDLVLIVGGDALHTAKWIHNIPVICIAAPVDVPLLSSANLTGVVMQVAAKVQLEKIMATIPGYTKIGLVFDPIQSGEFVKGAIVDAEHLGLRLIAVPAISPGDISTALTRLKGEVDVVWMLPDLTINTPNSMELFTLFSFENKIPLVTYSDNLLQHGVLMSIECDPYDIGRQTGELAERIYSQKGDTGGRVDARKGTVTINKTIAEKFGIRTHTDKADKVKYFDRIPR